MFLDFQIPYAGPFQCFVNDFPDGHKPGLIPVQPLQDSHVRKRYFHSVIRFVREWFLVQFGVKRTGPI